MSQRRAPAPAARHASSGPRLRKALYAIAGVGVFGALVWLVMQGFTNTTNPAGATASRFDSDGLAVGQVAPGLALPATTADKLDLQSYRGSKLVVYFYEGAG